MWRKQPYEFWKPQKISARLTPLKPPVQLQGCTLEGARSHMRPSFWPRDRRFWKGRATPDLYFWAMLRVRVYIYISFHQSLTPSWINVFMFFQSRFLENSSRLYLCLENHKRQLIGDIVTVWIKIHAGFILTPADFADETMTTQLRDVMEIRGFALFYKHTCKT